MAVTICLDPGHVDKYNRGGYSEYYEGTQMFKLAYILKEELEKYNGIKVIVTRAKVTDDPALATRGQMAKNAGAKLFLSLHSDACNTESVNRVSVFRSILLPNSVKLGQALMDAVVNTISKDIPITASTSILTRVNSAGNADYYGVIRSSAGGSVTESFILEHGFHTNYKQSLWLYSETNLRKLAQAEAAVIATYYGAASSNTVVDDVTTSTPSNPTTNTNYVSYKVVAGDSWWSIASNKMGSGLKMEELAAFNGKTTSTTLYVGDIVKIPTSSTALKYKTYTVKKGDSWWSIAASQMGNGAKYKELADYNGTSSDTILYVGDILKIPV